MYTWGSTFPASPVDGQLFLNDRKEIFQYNHALRLWQKKTEFQLRTIFSGAIRLTGRSITKPFGEKNSEWVGNQWADYSAFNHCFLEVLTANQGSVLTRSALMTWPEFQTLCAGAIPNDGFVYSQDVWINVYDVQDPNWVPRIKTFNALYGALRGRYSYYFGKARLSNRAGLEAGATLAFGLTSLSSSLVQLFLLKTPAAPDNNSLIFVKGDKGLYSLYGTGTSIRFETGNSRRCWNNTSNVWQDVPAGTTWTLYGEPRILSKRYDTAPAPTTITTPNNHIGFSFLTDERVGVVIQCLQSNDLFTFMVKPLGVTHVAVVGKTLTSPGVLVETTSDNMYQKRFVLVTDLQRNGSMDGYRFSINTAGSRGVYPKSLSDRRDRLPNGSARFPDRLDTRLVDRTTGLVSGLPKSHLYLVRRATNSLPHWRERTF